MAGSGGAWKVAFADFMTAMMALFLVLWISAQDKKILISTAQYFKNPFTSPLDKSAGVMPFNNKTTSSTTSSDDGGKVTNGKQIETIFFNSVAADFMKLLHLDEDVAKRSVDVQVTSDGLRVTLFDRAQKPLFKKDTAEFTEWGLYAIQGLAWMIDRHHFRVTIDGHTSQPLEEKEGNYTDWELSADRANAARRTLVHYAVEPKYVERITGYAGTKPLEGEKSDAEANSRITLSLALNSKSPKTASNAKAGGPPEPKAGDTQLILPDKKAHP